MQLAMVAAGFTPGEADQLRRSMAAWKRKGGLEPFEAKLNDGMRAQRLRAEFADAHLPPDPRLRRIRLSRIALGELRAAGLRFRLAQASPAGGVLRGAAQQPADGLLRAGAAGAGRAPPRRRGAAGRRERQRLGLHARERRACGSGCAWSAACRKTSGRGIVAAGLIVQWRQSGLEPQGACVASPRRARCSRSPGTAGSRTGRRQALGRERRSTPRRRSHPRRRCARRAKARTSSPTTRASA